MGNQAMGIVEGICDQYQTLYPRVESLCGKPETISYCVRNSMKQNPAMSILTPTEACILILWGGH